MVRFGVAGFPLAYLDNKENKKDRRRIFRWVAGLGLDAVELQMTYGPRTKPETCREYNELARDAGVRISVHAAYYIVLTSSEKEKIKRSIDTLLKTFELAEVLGAEEVILHPGPLYSGTEGAAFERFVENCSVFLNSLGESKIGLFVETAGKLGQLGSFDDILSLSTELNGVHPCIDFGHVHARTLGSLESESAIMSLCDRVELFLVENASKRIHFHYTPIHFGPKGEIQHRAVDDKYPIKPQQDLFGEFAVGETSLDGMYHPRPQHVAKAISTIGADFTIISETHNSQEIGALELKKHASL